jgi:hypothetical protein
MTFYESVKLKKRGSLNPWEITTKIAEALRPVMLQPSVDTVFKYIETDWPNQLLGRDGADALSSLTIVPFLLSAIETSEDLKELVEKTMTALDQNDSAILHRDAFLKKYWAIEKKRRT